MAGQSKSMISNNSNVTDSTKQDEWHWPVPLHFDSLAAMLLLVAFALLILTCSYWKTIGP